MDKIAYLGRFQPFCIHHGEVVKTTVNKYSASDFFIGVADWQGPRTQENFLTGEEAIAVAKLTLADLHLQVRVEPAMIYPDSTLEDTLKISLIAQGVKILLSGSDKTINAALAVYEQASLSLTIDRLPENPTDPHASTFRQSYMDGSDTRWKSMVSPTVVTYFEVNHELKERLRALPSDSPNKRPWKSQAS